MARSIEQLLRSLRKAPPDRELVRSALAAKTTAAGVIVEAAAKACEEHGLHELTPELASAFTGLCEPKRDPGCRGRAAIVHALHALDQWAPEVFVAGLSVVQLDAMKFDDGAQIRGACAHAHVHMLRPDALDVCAEMLADPCSLARLGALNGIGDSGRIDATALIRFKLKQGPDDGDVLAACFDALFALDREIGIEVAHRWLAVGDARGDAAALALGSKRVTEAVDALVAYPKRQVSYLALALLRTDRANAVLVDAIRTGSASNARTAAEALATFKEDAAIAKLIVDAAKSIQDRGLRDEIAALAR